MYICSECNIEFKNHQSKANHMRWSHPDEEKMKSFKEKISKIAIKSTNERFGDWITETTECYHCKNSLEIKYRPGKRKEKNFCNIACSCGHAGTFSGWTDELRNSVSLKIKQLWKDGYYENTSANNHIRNKRFSSKGERLMLSELKNKFPQYSWKSGGRLKHKDVSLTRDAYSNELKICIEYDGIWHFKDIYGQLANKQLKDELLKDWCIENGYRLIRVEDGHYNINALEEAIKSNEPYITIGTSY
jgi:hypothetical protein